MKRRTAWTLAGAAAAAMTTGALGIALPATATEDSPYVTVAWSYASHPDITAPQPFLASTPGANLTAFDSLAASPEWCGKPIQVDVYQRTDKHGVSWESLKATGALLYGHDGGYLAYNAGIGTPYRVITSEEYPCTTTPPVPSPSPTAPSTEPQPTSSPSTPSSSPSPTDSPAPTSEPTTPAPSDEPTSTPTPSAPVTVPTPTPTSHPGSHPTSTATPSSPTAGTTAGTPSTVATSPADLHLPVVSG